MVSLRRIELYFKRITGKPEPAPLLRTPIMVDGMEAIDHEAQTSFQEKAPHDQICPVFT
jgi:hypothetical protein